MYYILPRMFEANMKKNINFIWLKNTYLKLNP